MDHYIFFGGGGGEERLYLHESFFVTESFY